MSDSESITVNISLVAEPVTVSLTSDPQPVTVNVTLESSPVAVSVADARDAYQIAVAEGYAGTRAEWLASLEGPAGPAGPQAEIVMLTLAEYLALPPETQMDGRWYVIPKT